MQSRISVTGGLRLASHERPRSEREQGRDRALCHGVHAAGRHPARLRAGGSVRRDGVAPQPYVPRALRRGTLRLHEGAAGPPRAAPAADDADGYHPHRLRLRLRHAPHVLPRLPEDDGRLAGELPRCELRVARCETSRRPTLATRNAQLAASLTPSRLLTRGTGSRIA